MTRAPGILVLFLLPGLLWADEPKATKTTFELLKTQHMVVEAKINGKGPYRLIFDTGAPVTLLNNKVAREAGVIPANFKRPVFALFGNAGEFKIKSLRIGDVEADNVPTFVMDHPTVTAIANALGPIEGIVGFPFFARYRMTIDYQAKEMTFVPNGFEPPDMMKHLLKVLTTDAGKPKVLAAGGLLGMRVTKDAGDEEAGVNIAEVFPGGPAEKAGLKAGDRLLTLGGRWTDSVLDTYEAARPLTVDSDVRAVVRREGTEKTITIHVANGL